MTAHGGRGRAPRLFTRLIWAEGTRANRDQRDLRGGCIALGCSALFVLPGPGCCTAVRKLNDASVNSMGVVNVDAFNVHEVPHTCTTHRRYPSIV